MEKIFFTSDLHIGHDNAIWFDNRPFSSVEEMDAELIRRWNAKVGREDTVYVLGDMIWKSRKQEAAEIVKSLNGKIVLILGNHDHFLLSTPAKELFEDIRDYAEIAVSLKDGTRRRCILSHYFIPMYNGHRRTAIHLHGHSHVSDEAALELEIARHLNELGVHNGIYNVGCMYWNYEPVTLDEILAGRQGNFAIQNENAEASR